MEKLQNFAEFCFWWAAWFPSAMGDVASNDDYTLRKRIRVFIILFLAALAFAAAAKIFVTFFPKECGLWLDLPVILLFYIFAGMAYHRAMLRIIGDSPMSDEI